jgi:uncharacterized protein (TIGR01777 family)
VPQLESRNAVPVTAAEAFRWHARPGAFTRLSPPWRRVEVAGGWHGIAPGSRVEIRIGTPPLALRWVARHGEVEEGRRFVDHQEEGPFASFVHEHLFEDVRAGRSVVVDRIDYRLPFGAAGSLVLDRRVRTSLTRLFRYRRAVTAGDLGRHAPYVGSPPLRVAITGASGLIGGQLAAFLEAGGHEVLRAARGRTPRAGEFGWDPALGRVDHEALEGLDAVVHLAGAGIADGRWTEARRAAILRSRVDGTRLVADAMAVLRTPPRVFITASAVGYYGDRGSERLDESSSAGTGFLADVARAWEAAAEPAARAGVRTVRARFGMIVTSRGGAVAKMRLPFLLGAGGPIGGGRQGVSWIALDDALYAIHHVIRTETVTGAVNVVAPEAVPQAEFAAALARSLRRPAILPMPAAAVRALFGAMGEEVLLAGQLATPAALTRSGFRWDVAALGEALAR